MIGFRKITATFLTFLLVASFVPSSAFAQVGNGSGKVENTYFSAEQNDTMEANNANSQIAIGSSEIYSSDDQKSEETDSPISAIANATKDGQLVINEDSGAVSFIYIENPEVPIRQEQNIAITLDDDHVVVLSATLEYVRSDTGQVSYLEAAKTVDNSMLFTKMFSDLSDIAEYQLTSVTYLLQHDEDVFHSVSFGDTESLGQVFSVVDATNATDVLSSNGRDPEIGVTAYSVGDNGGIVTTDDIKSAIDDASSLRTQATDGNLIVALDPGHGGSEPGASAYGFVEKDLTLKIAEYCKAELEQYNNVSVYMTRTGDYNVSLLERVRNAVAAGANVFVSIHLNSGGGSGAEVYIPNNSSYNYYTHSEGSDLAALILAQIGKLGLDTSRGIKVRDSEYYAGSGPFYYDDGHLADFYTVINESRELGIPGIIVEHAFMDNASDAAFLANDANLRNLGIADATAIAEKYGLSKWTWDASVDASVSADQKTATLTVDGDGQPEGLTAVSIPVWGSVNGQNDLIWYSAARNSDGNWQAIIPIREHGESGLYIAHVYAATTGNAQLVGATTFTVDTPSATVATRSASDGGFDVVMTSSSPSGVDRALVAAWSDAVGQDDVVWYNATKQSNGTYVAHIDPSRHNFAAGDYTAHTYFTAGNGVEAFAGEVHASVTLLETSLIAQVSADQKTATIEASGGYLSDASSVTFPVWSDAGGQDDIIWYAASRGSDGTWRATVPISSHRTAGTYNVHMYASVSGGTVWAATTFTVDTPSATVAVESSNEELGTFSITIKDIVSRSGVNSISVPVWSVSDQSDIHWYPASKRADGSWSVSVNIQDHTFSIGSQRTYTAHVYIMAGNGISVLAGSTSVEMQHKGSMGYSIMGKSNCTVDQMAAFFESRGHVYPADVYCDYGAATLEDFCKILLEEAEYEGVRAEVLFAQVILETGGLSFTGDVQPDQCNFGGLGATGGGASGLKFSDVRTGLRAQTQHLKAYASTDNLVGGCVDPRFQYVNRGCAPNVEDLGNGKWASDPNYGVKLRSLIESMMALPATTSF